jgi:probable phosphoglycerate mutase
LTDLTPIPFWFLRHGETDWNAKRLSQGRTDVPLNAAGRAQAEQAATRMAGHGIASIVASTLGRAQETARIVGGVLGLGFTTDPDLRETSFGEQEGKLMGPWYDDWVAGTYTPAGGESFADLQARVVPAVNRALTHPAPVLIVAHGGMFRAVRAAMGLSALVRTENGIPLYCLPGAPWSLKEG